MDIEGYAKRGLRKGEKDIESRLAGRIREVKDIPEKGARKLAEAAVIEAKATLNPTGTVLAPITSGVTMGRLGVGSRGAGDFYLHEKIAEVIGRTSAVIDTSHLDDSGVVMWQGNHIVVTIDGLHSRLSDFPFLAGFHAARAALRDIYVMGARPLALLSDIHVADDGDVAKILDHIAGITAVSELTGVPLVTGSTLRIGGDMVIGERMTGGVGAVGVAVSLTPRKAAMPGDVILMTEGAGGGTISTAALYYGMHEIVDETINVTFIEACEALLGAGVVEKIHAMTDVTNGGVRGDAREISKTAGIGLVFEEEKMNALVNRRVLAMLEKLEIDYLGVSLDSLLMIAPEQAAGEVETVLGKAGIAVDRVGWVEEGAGSWLIANGRRVPFVPRFRESAYTPVKKVVGEEEPRDFDAMRRAVDGAAHEAVEKRRRVVSAVRERKAH